MRRLICWLFGHREARQYIIMPQAGSYRLAFACKRCNQPLGTSPTLQEEVSRE